MLLTRAYTFGAEKPASLVYSLDRVSWSPSWPGTLFVHQAGLNLRDPPASATEGWDLRRASPHQESGFLSDIHFCWGVYLIVEHTCGGQWTLVGAGSNLLRS